MASVQHATLVADTVTTLTFTETASPPPANIEVTNVTGTAAVYFTVDGTTPTVGGTNCQVIPAAIGSLAVSEESGGSTFTVKLRSSGTPGVSVRTF